MQTRAQLLQPSYVSLHLISSCRDLKYNSVSNKKKKKRGLVIYLPLIDFIASNALSNPPSMSISPNNVSLILFTSAAEGKSIIHKILSIAPRRTTFFTYRNHHHYHLLISKYLYVFQVPILAFPEANLHHEQYHC